MARFLVEDGPEIGAEWGLADGAIVGADAACAVRLSDAAVAPRHAALRLVKGRFLILDMGSRAGTLLNGVKVKQAALADGDRVRVGETTLLFMADEAPAEAAPEAPAEAGEEPDAAAQEEEGDEAEDVEEAEEAAPAATGAGESGGLSASITPARALEWGLGALAVLLAFLVASYAVQVALRLLSG